MWPAGRLHKFGYATRNILASGFIGSANSGVRQFAQRGFARLQVSSGIVVIARVDVNARVAAFNEVRARPTTWPLPEVIFSWFTMAVPSCSLAARLASVQLWCW